MVIVRIRTCPSEKETIAFTSNSSPELNCCQPNPSFSNSAYESFPVISKSGVVEDVPPAPRPISEGEVWEGSPHSQLQVAATPIAAKSCEAKYPSNLSIQILILFLIP